MTLTTAQHDRAAGVILGTAAGDALGAPYEFQPPRGPELAVVMEGGGGWEVGEWTDDTSMAVAIAEVAAAGADLRDEEAQDTIVRRWVEWKKSAKDVGIQTRDVLAAIDSVHPAAPARTYAARRFADGVQSAGNGSLMRTAPVALAYLDLDGQIGEDATVEAAIAISDLTHGDPNCADACVLWCLAIRHAVLTGELDIRRGLESLAADRRMVWSERLDEAERLRPQDFPSNGWVVGALQAAWSAIVGTPIPDDDPAGQVFRADHLRHALDAAVRCGYDTDTVAAIAGGLLGALHGASAVPAEWRRTMHGWPGMRVRELDAVPTAILRGGQPDPFDYGYELKGDLSARAVHPLDESLHLGAIGALRPLDANIDAVVSLCRVGNRDADAIPVGTEHIEVRLVDQDGADKNPNLGFVLRDTVELLRSLRAEGKTVLLHCVQARSRTPTVAALYGAAVSDESAADVLARLERALPAVWPISAFRTIIEGS
jgi:ADP-ribosyl-[dinitrogen reductase] hydrolase